MLFKSKLYVHKKQGNKYFVLPIPLFVPLRLKTKTVDIIQFFNLHGNQLTLTCKYPACNYNNCLITMCKTVYINNYG